MSRFKSTSWVRAVKRLFLFMVLFIFVSTVSVSAEGSVVGINEYLVPIEDYEVNVDYEKPKVHYVDVDSEFVDSLPRETTEGGVKSYKQPMISYEVESWALGNLVLLLVSIIILIVTILNRKSNFIKIGNSLLVSIIFGMFIMSVDSIYSMVLWDEWTLLMIVAVGLCLVSYMFSSKKGGYIR